MVRALNLYLISFFVAMAGCGSSDGSSALGNPGSGLNGRNASEIGAAGGHLVDGAGFALYQASGPCLGSCLTEWPPLDANQIPTAINGANSASIGLNLGQVTYNGNPLYYFVSDTSPGETGGNGVGGFSLVAP
jgi:predicted lipoprotein with Yx(FWY)xxD motif